MCLNLPQPLKCKKDWMKLVQLKDQDDDLHQVMNGNAGDKEEDLQQIQRFLLFLLILRWLKMFQITLKTKIMK